MKIIESHNHSYCYFNSQHDVPQMARRNVCAKPPREHRYVSCNNNHGARTLQLNFVVNGFYILPVCNSKLRALWGTLLFDAWR